MAPPPPPPLCLPFGSKKKGRPLSPSRTFSEKDSYPGRSSYRTGDSSRSSLRPRSRPRAESYDSAESLARQNSNSYSPTATITSKAENLTFKSDSESYKDLPTIRSASPPPPQPRKLGWGFGWGLGKQREKETGVKKDKGLLMRKNSLPIGAELPYTPRSANTSEMSLVSPSGKPGRPQLTPIPDESPRSSTRSNSAPIVPPKRSNTQRSNGSGRSGASGQSGQSGASGASGGSGLSGGTLSRFSSQRRPTMSPQDSQSTLVGSALERKINDVEEPKVRVDTAARLQELRVLMAKDNLDY